MFDSTGHLTRDAMLRYLNNRDEAGERLAMDEHLKNCELCADAMEGLQLFENPVEVEAALSRIDDKVASRDERRSIAPVWRRYAAAAAVVVVMGTSLWLVNDMMMPGGNDLAHAETEETEAAPAPKNTTIQEKQEPGSPDAEINTGLVTEGDSGNTGNYSFNWESDTDGARNGLSNPGTNSTIVQEKRGDYLEEPETEIVSVEAEPIMADVPAVEEESQKRTAVQPPVVSSQNYGFGGANNQPSGNAPPVAQDKVTSDNATDVVDAEDLVNAKTDTTVVLDEINYVGTVTIATTESVNKSGDRQENTSLELSDEKGITRAPEFTGGTEALKAYLATFKKPDNTVGISGAVYVSFTVKPNGKVKDVTIERGLHQDIDAALVKFLEDMPKWEPALQNGDKVEEKVQMQVQVR